MIDEWQGRTGDSWAAEWRRTDRSFGPLTEELLRRSREFQFSRAVDIGCGAGELSLALARGRPGVSVTGVDVSPALVETARERSANLANLSFAVADAAVWSPPEDTAPDLFVSRHGVMFFPDATAAFTHLAAIAADSAGLLFSCFRARGDNPVFGEVGRLLPPGPSADPDEPGPFAFADRTRVERMLTDAGWAALRFEPFDFAMVVGGGDDPIADAVEYFTRIGPAARQLRDMGPAEGERARQRIAELASRNLYDGIVSLRASTWIVTGRKA
jgi:SAM-dependent methyltransferase